MILESKYEFSKDQALTTTGAVSTNVLDLGSLVNIGQGKPMAVFFKVVVAADFTTGDETYNFQLQNDAAAAMASPIVTMSRFMLTPQLTVGDIFVLPIPEQNERFLRLNYVLAGTTPLLTISAYLTFMDMIDSNTLVYADGFTIS